MTERATKKAPATRDAAPAGLPQHIHLLGAGGAGVSGAARLLAKRGHTVTGHDREASPFTAVLESLGVPLVVGQSEAELLPATTELVARSAAVDDDDPQVVCARERGLPVIKYAQLVGALSPAGRTLAVAGTHGKTTTTWMLHGSLASTGGPAAGALVGGLHQTLRTNAVPPDEGGWFALEACEYDRSFLHLRPTGAIVTNLEEDHLDCYGSLDELERAFCRFAHAVDPDGVVVLGPEVPDAIASACRARVWRLGKEVQVDLLGETRGRFRFRVRGPGWATPPVELAVPGRFNVDDAAMAVALAVGGAGVPPASAARGVAEYPGTARRFESWGDVGGVALVHDYAHHPTEVRVTLEAARRAFPGRRLHVLFQPHQASRTARCMGGFVEALRGADRVVVADVYGARRHIDRIEGADAETLVTRLRRAGVDASVGGPPRDACAQFAGALARRSCALVLGAGDIDTVQGELIDAVAVRFARRS
ncbi:MAG: Mur ligase domain-containing protein [Planctomycetota bacterium]